MCKEATCKSCIICTKYVPWWIWLIFAALLIATIGGTIAGIKNALNALSVDITKEEYKRGNEMERIVMTETEIDFHLKKHDTNLQHERELEEGKNVHKLYKVGIILPCTVGIVALICLTIYLGFIRTKPRKHKPKKEENGNLNTKECQITIPRARISDFNSLKLMGYNKMEIVKAINNSIDIDSAMDHIHQNGMDTNAQQALFNTDKYENVDELQSNSNRNIEDERVSIWI